MARIDKSQQDLFYEKITQPGFATAVNVTFNDHARFDHNNWKAYGVVFKNCVFESLVSFMQVNLWCGVQFENCTFHQRVDFDFCDAGQDDAQFNSRRSASIEFVHCEFSHKLTIRNCRLHLGVWAGEQTNFKSLHLSDTEAGKIQFDGLTINGMVEISKVENAAGFFFDNTVFNEAASFYECNSKMIINHCKFGEVFCSADNFRGLFIDNSSFSEEVQFIGCLATLIRFEELVFEKSISMGAFESQTEHYGLINELKIIDCDFKGGYIFRGLPERVAEPDIQSLCLSCSEKMKGTITFEYCQIKSMYTMGTNNAIITFAFSMLEQIDCTQLINKSTINFISVKPRTLDSGLINIDKSMLGKMIFSDFDFNSYQCIKINHSNVTEIVTNSVNWFTSEKLKSNNPALQKDVYRQLKFAMEKQGDQHTALRFRRDEQRAYRLELRKHPTTIANMGDKMIMWLSRSNDYGYNWLKPLGFTILTVFLFYLVLAIIASPVFVWAPAIGNLRVTIAYLYQNAPNLFLLLNPAHKTSELFDTVTHNRYTFGFYTLDFFERLILSYFLFQTITAFRKYTK